MIQIPSFSQKYLGTAGTTQAVHASWTRTNLFFRLPNQYTPQRCTALTSALKLTSQIAPLSTLCLPAIAQCLRPLFSSPLVRGAWWVLLACTVWAVRTLAPSSMQIDPLLSSSMTSQIQTSKFRLWSIPTLARSTQQQQCRVDLTTSSRSSINSWVVTFILVDHRKGLWDQVYLFWGCRLNYLFYLSPLGSLSSAYPNLIVYRLRHCKQRNYSKYLLLCLLGHTMLLQSPASTCLFSFVHTKQLLTPTPINSHTKFPNYHRIVTIGLAANLSSVS